ncbi:MAG: c-type cytochrome biogenesis protein CcmF, partial [Gammaproteobacteria bacterium]|nr:c-type cytochrome biogenesis protein CcmF [Gammaproteobacteria bacterium]
MQLAHFGLAVFVIGVALVSTYQDERDVRMAPQETVMVGGYTFTFIGVRNAEGPNYRAAIGTVELAKDGRVLRTMHPEKRNYNSSGMPMTEAAIDSGLFRDVYVSLGEPLGEEAWAVRVYYKPFVGWIWGGCLLMALGGIFAASDRRYRLKVSQSSSAAAGAVA